MKKTIALLIVSLLWLGSWPAQASKLEPEFKGGKIRLRLQAWPKSFNNLTANSTYINMIWRFVGVDLTMQDLDTFENKPWLAKSWKVSKDKKTYTFFLNKNAKWFDGKPITAEDVKFSFDLAYDKKRCTLCESGRSFIGPLEHVKVIDKHTVEIRVKNRHFDNLAKLGTTLSMLPKHKYNKGNFNKDYNKVMWSGGPYTYDKKASKFRKSIVLKRVKNYWANEYPHVRERFNFDKIVYKYIDDPTVAFEAFKRRNLDAFYYGFESVDQWVNNKGAPYTDKRLGLVEAPHYNPSRWGGAALNMRSGVTADLKVRKALQHMFNRKLIIDKVLKGLYRPVSGPFMYGSKYSANIKPTDFDLKKAAKLLKEAGFTKAGKDGFLFRMKDGKKQKASMTLMYASEKHEPWVTILKEDAKKVGFEIIPRYIDWSAGIKKVDQFKFDAFVIGWTGDPVPGPSQLFHGRTAMNKGTSNIPGLNIPELNKLIDQGPGMFKEKERLAAYHKMEKMIVGAQPYLFRWTVKNHKVAYWKDKLSPTGKPYRKFSGNLERFPFYYHWTKAK